ncbi:Arginine exporter protein ArgO [Priestia megaterium Q3]|uniref:Arginine exporter protein ArgO n=1 Tax=Priestia megaterium Q3 TaxID=1452722 RepID=A0A806TGD6_PRIMG|nr:LysE/ArgO family amino acid transporter [Priestia megaterium]AKP77164.1 Arginine exporter protein ArgO [Priestia megaterium Q3]
MLVAIVHGIFLSFGLILPLGVQNVFVFNQGVNQSSLVKALPVVIAAALCDTILIILAVLGVSVIVLGIPLIKAILLIAGIMFLFYMGVVTWRSQPSLESSHQKTFSTKKQIMFAISVSLLNPHAVIDTIGVIGTSSTAYQGDERIFFTLSCICVSFAWFLFLALVGKKIGKLNNSKKFIIILNKVSAIIMWGTSIYITISLM